MIEAGKLPHRITVQKLSETRDGYGQKTQSWVTVATVWAGVETFAAGEIVNGQQVKAEATHTIKARYVPSLFDPPGILPSMRILFKGRTFHIISVKNVDFLNEEYRIAAKEIVSPNPS